MHDMRATSCEDCEVTAALLQGVTQQRRWEPLSWHTVSECEVSCRCSREPGWWLPWALAAAPFRSRMYALSTRSVLSCKGRFRGWGLDENPVWWRGPQRRTGKSEEGESAPKEVIQKLGCFLEVMLNWFMATSHWDALFWFRKNLRAFQSSRNYDHSGQRQSNGQQRAELSLVVE